MVSEKAVEVAAKAIWEAMSVGEEGWPSWDDAEAQDKNNARICARAALEAALPVIGEQMVTALVEAGHPIAAAILSENLPTPESAP